MDSKSTPGVLNLSLRQFLQPSRANSTQVFWLLPVKIKPFEEFLHLGVKQSIFQMKTDFRSILLTPLLNNH